MGLRESQLESAGASVPQSIRPLLIESILQIFTELSVDQLSTPKIARGLIDQGWGGRYAERLLRGRGFSSLLSQMGIWSRKRNGCRTYSRSSFLLFAEEICPDKFPVTTHQAALCPLATIERMALRRRQQFKSGAVHEVPQRIGSIQPKVATLSRDGVSNKEIAKALGIKQKAVRFHLSMLAVAQRATALCEVPE